MALGSKSTSSLPLVEDCSGCGACCREMTQPPGLYMRRDGKWYDCGYVDPDPIDIPDEAMLLLIEAYESNDGDPCCWYDAESHQCRFYEHRPAICQDFEVGGDACRGWQLSGECRGSVPEVPWQEASPCEAGEMCRVRCDLSAKAITEGETMREFSLRQDSRPTISRTAVGIEKRVDRIRCLGNGQVPAVVVRAWEALSRDF